MWIERVDQFCKLTHYHCVWLYFMLMYIPNDKYMLDCLLVYHAQHMHIYIHFLHGHAICIFYIHVI